MQCICIAYVMAKCLSMHHTLVLYQNVVNESSLFSAQCTLRESWLAEGKRQKAEYDICGPWQ